MRRGHCKHGLVVSLAADGQVSASELGKQLEAADVAAYGALVCRRSVWAGTGSVHVEERAQRGCSGRRALAHVYVLHSEHVM